MAFEVRWAVAGESIVLQLVAKLEGKEYMSFGLSGDVSKSVMIGGDVVVVWVDPDTLKGYAVDYYLGDKSQCSGPTGSCPDTRIAENTNNVRLLNAAMVNGYSIVTYQRPLKGSDQYDLPIYTNQSQAIIWAIGLLNQRNEVSFHSSYLKKDSFIDFGRPAKWNCPLPEGETPARQKTAIQNRQQEQVVSKETTEPPPPPPSEPEESIEPSTTTAPRRDGSGQRRRGGTRISTRQPAANTEDAEEGQASRRESTRTRGSNNNKASQRETHTVPPPTPVKERNAWYIPPIECYEPEDGVYYAQMGPTGGKRGYPAITGHVGWGISWYINGLLIPEINVVRGKTYNFITEGGDNPEVSAKYHPFYITDDPVGGYAYKTAEEKKNVTIFAGVRLGKNGEEHPTGVGRLCHWTHTGDNDADDFDSFGAYQRTLQLKCDQGEPGVIEWTPDSNTPDTVYYQCFTHRYLGWKINVHDTCQQGAASELKPSIVEAPKDVLDSFSDQSNVELEASPSIRQETTMVMPNHILVEEITADNRSQPTVSETLTTLLPTSPTGQQIPHTSLGFQSPPYNQPKHHFIHHRDTGTSRFMVSRPPHDQTNEDYLRNKIFITKRMTTTVRPMTIISPYLYRPVAMVNPFVAVPKNTPVNQMIYLSLKKQIPVTYKKPLYRQTPTIIHTPISYSIRPEVSHVPMLKTPQQTFLNTLAVPVKTQLISTIKNVEVSPQQASTEREPEIQTAASAMVYNHPLTNEQIQDLQTPSNTSGFKPESIVIEGGFKPIINKLLEDKVQDNIDPDIDTEGEIGIIHIRGEKRFETLQGGTSDDDISKPKRKFYKKVPPIKVYPRSLIDSDIEPEMAANDRVESYYLPPPGQTDKPKLGKAKLPSEIDFETPSLPTNNQKSIGEPSSKQIAASPPDIVVTFDGKRVSGASLTAKPFEKAVALERGSKATELLKAHPQSVPFQGDLPPLSPNVLFNVRPQQGVLNRDLDTPLPPPAGPTKLRRVRRMAHHTPEHTAQQMQEMMMVQGNSSSTSGSERFRGFGFVSSVLTGSVLLVVARG